MYEKLVFIVNCAIITVEVTIRFALLKIRAKEY